MIIILLLNHGNSGDHEIQLISQLSGRDSFRDFDIKYNNNLKLLGEFEILSYSQLSRLNASKYADYFKGIFDYILSVFQ